MIKRYSAISNQPATAKIRIRTVAHCCCGALMGALLLLATDVASGQAKQADPPVPAKSPSQVAKVIQSRMQAQVDDWNQGDIDGFMQVYWRSPKLSFSSGGKTTRGWQQTLEGYQSRYPDRETMGTLMFKDLEISELGDTVALVLGKWHLDRKPPKLPVGGNFSLVFRKIDGEWVIVHDHTSVLKTDEKD